MFSFLQHLATAAGSVDAKCPTIPYNPLQLKKMFTIFTGKKWKKHPSSCNSNSTTPILLNSQSATTARRVDPRSSAIPTFQDPICWLLRTWLSGSNSIA